MSQKKPTYWVRSKQIKETGDLSIVYPLARGTAPLLILIWGSALLRERPSIGGIAGVGLIIVGLCILNLPRSICKPARASR